MNYVQGNFQKINSWLFITNNADQKAERWHIQSTELKQKKKLSTKTFYITIYQNVSKIKYSQKTKTDQKYQTQLMK